MQALYLNVKHRMGINGDTGALHHKGGKILFVFVLYGTQALQNVLCKVRKLLRVLAVGSPYALVKQCGKTRVGIAEPAAVSHTVRYVGKALGVHTVKALEYRLGEYLGMELRHAVYRMRADHGKVRHVDLPVAEYAHSRYAVPVAGVCVPRLTAEALVYFLDYHVDARQFESEYILAPLFKRLGHDRVVGI